MTPPGCLGGDDSTAAAPRPCAPAAVLVHAHGRWLASPGSTIRGMAFDQPLADRVRTCLQQGAGVSERKMFGGLALLTVGVYGDGLIARIGAQDTDAATAGPGVRPFGMTGPPMRGIVVIDSAMLDARRLTAGSGRAAATWQACRRSSPVPAAAARSSYRPADRRAECGRSGSSRRALGDA